jgi:putative FmdB family regulatory protein
MPLYEYVCHDCQASFERYVKAWGEPVACTACQGANVEKCVSTFAMAGLSGGGAPASMGGGCATSGGCGCGRGGCGCH